MAVDDDVLHKNPFAFELATVIVNDSVTREAITKDQMRKFLKFVHDDNEKWMPDFMAGLAKGVEKSRGLVEKAVAGMSADMVISPRMAAVQMAGGSYGGGQCI